jgi:hypothetical protein
LGVFVIAMMGQIFLMISQSLNFWLGFAFFSLWVICESIGNVVTANFVVNMYIVDVSEAEERYFSSIGLFFVFSKILKGLHRSVKLLDGRR